MVAFTKENGIMGNRMAMDTTRTLKVRKELEYGVVAKSSSGFKRKRNQTKTKKNKSDEPNQPIPSPYSVHKSIINEDLR